MGLPTLIESKYTLAWLMDIADATAVIGNKAFGNNANASALYAKESWFVYLVA